MAEYENISNELIKLLSESVIKDFDYKEFEKSAQTLKDTYYQNIKMIEVYNRQLLNDSIINKSNIKTARFNLWKEIYLRAFEFENKLNTFLYGEKFPRKAVFVYESRGHNLISYEISMEDLLDFVNEDLRFRAGNKKLLEEKSQGETLEKNSEKRSNMALSAYKGASNRLDRYYQYAKTAKQGGLLLWKDSGYWRVMRVSNAGDLKEAYTAMLLDTHGIMINNIGSSPYFSHELVGAYAVNYVSKIDNLPAILEEDIISTTLGLQFGVKSKKAQLPSIVQYINSAEVVLKAFSNNNVVKKEIFNNIYQKYGQRITRNNEVKINEIVNEEVKDFVKKTERMINKQS